MKNLFFSLILLVALAPAAGARGIGPVEAEALATEFLHGESAGAPALKRVSGRGGSAAAAQPYYIYNAGGSAGGFVIISGDDRFGTVLGYSDHGNIDVSAMPDGLADLLDLYTAAYNAIGTDNGAAGQALSKAPAVVVAPLLGEISWGQDAPFNANTPVSTGTTHFYTGCVATAATQIMRYYSYPTKGIGTKTYTDPLSHNTLTADFGNTTYDWANMPADPPASPTGAQTSAYSTLAAHFGIAVEMQYEAAGSGAYDMLVPYALRNYFGYDAGVRGHLREYYSTSEWMALIKGELDAGRPVFYGGTSDAGSGGHAFVVDGYDSEDYVHVNWGWYGRSNGYFKINHLDPESLGEGGGAGGYNRNQDIVTGIRPAVAGSKRDYAVYGEIRMNVDGPFSGKYQIMTSVANLDVEPVSGRLEGVLLKDGKIVATLGGQDISVDGFKGGRSGSKIVTLSNVASAVTGVADGEYRLKLAFRPQGESDWIVLRHSKGFPGYADVVVSSGIISIVSRHVPAPDVVLRSAIVTDGDIYAGGNMRVNFSLENRSGDFDISEITLRLTGKDHPAAVFDSAVQKEIYNQSVESVDLTAAVSADITPGRYYLTALVRNSSGEYLFDDSEVGRTEVNVLASAGGPVIRAVASPTWQVNNTTAAVPDQLAQGETLYVSCSFRNAAAPGKANVLCRLTDVTTGVSTPLLQVGETFDGSSPKKLIFSRYVPNAPGTYRIDFSQIGDDYVETPIAQVGQPVEITVHEASNIVADVVSFDFPKHIAFGERVPFTLVAKGRMDVSKTLYIRIRQLTNRNGEIVTMGTKKFETGKELTVSGNYTPGSDIAEGLYMAIVETGTSNNSTPLGNYAAYAQTVAIGNISGIDTVEAEQSAVAVWVDGTQLRVVAANGLEIGHTEIYNISGSMVARDRYDLGDMPKGVYIVAVTLTNGNRVASKIVLR